MSSAHGVLVVDKPRGPTSHDVVAKVRRALGTRAVGHAGTLDPMATGVLVVAVGEGTKLVRWLTADDKTYRASIRLGAETDTLDADGSVIETAPVRTIDLETTRAAAAGFIGPIRQRAPIFSAIKVGGRALHELARKGEAVEAPERDVVVRRIEILSVEHDHIELEVEASKGFYVRSLARDLAIALGTRGHLIALRRTRSGAFDLEGSVPGAVLEDAARGDTEARAEVARALRPLAGACGSMPRIVLDARGAADARHGRPVHAGALDALEEDASVALLDEAGRLIAGGARAGDRLRVVRGFRTE